MSTSGNVQFQMVQERGWRRGLGNLLRGEFSSWFKSTRWLKHLVVWVLAINSMMAIMAMPRQRPPEPNRKAPLSS